MSGAWDVVGRCGRAWLKGEGVRGVVVGCLRG